MIVESLNHLTHPFFLLLLGMIELKAHAVKGHGKTHAKWSHVVTSRYRMLPEVINPRF